MRRGREGGRRVKEGNTEVGAAMPRAPRALPTVAQAFSRTRPGVGEVAEGTLV